MQINERTPAVTELAKHWQVTDALLGGTPAMRAAGKSLLPQWPAEENDAYNARLSTATLFPAFSRTLAVMAGKPFSRQITLSQDTPDQIKSWADDIDMELRSLHSFASDVFVNALSHGLCGILVDCPQAEGVQTRAQELAAGIRPYFVHIRHDQILGWRSEGQTLTQLRLSESEEVPDGLYGTKIVERVRLLEPGYWQLWEKVGDSFVLIDKGTTTMDRIPFVPVYGTRHGFMNGESPLNDLAYLNVKHWQSQSDQDTILHVARVPILAVMTDDPEAEIRVGGGTAMMLGAGDNAKFVEHSGAAIEAGAASLVALEEQMIQTGAELLVQKQGQRTATEAANDAEANKSELLRIAENFEDSLDTALELMAEWIGLPYGGSASLFKDFSAGSLSQASSQLIGQLMTTGQITRITGLKELQRRGELAGDIDVELEAEAVESEGVPFGEA